MNAVTPVVLGMLSLGPRSGYDIKTVVDRSTRFFWAASYGQIYPELRRLEEEGLIEGEDAPNGGGGGGGFKLAAARGAAPRGGRARPPEQSAEHRRLSLRGLFAALVASVLIYLYERRAGRDALLVRLSLGFVLVQSIVGLAADSTTVYLAQPVLIAGAWGLAFLVSVPLGRPLAGALACAWYPFPRSFRETASFKRVFGIESLVWAGYFLARSALRLVIRLRGPARNFPPASFVAGTPAV